VSGYLGEGQRSELDVVLDFENDATLFCGFTESVALVLGFAQVNDRFR
jgi:hypothetical protein